MEIKEYFKIIKKRLALIVIITIVAALSSAIISYYIIKPIYKTDISVIIGSNSNRRDEPSQDYSDTLMYQQMVQTYIEIAKTRRVAEDVIDTLDLSIPIDTLINMVSVSVKGNTEIINIAVKSEDKELARAMANQYAKSLKKISYDIRGVDNVKPMDQALLPSSPDRPNPILNTVIAFFLGLFISMGVVFIIEYLDNTIKRQEDMEKLFNLPVLGAIPLTTDEKENQK